MRARFAGFARLVVALVAAVVPLAACGSSVRTTVPSGGDSSVPENYPVNILDSKERREAAVAAWQQLFKDYGVPAGGQRVPELYPFTYTPQSTLGTGPIRLVPAAGEPLDEERTRLLLRQFITERADLLGVKPENLSLDGVMNAGQNARKYVFLQAGYPHPIASPWGRLEIIVTNGGEIIQLMDTAVPVVELPVEPRIAREEAQRRVVGTTFTYGDIAGRPQTLTISDPAQVRVEQLVVYPEMTEAALRMRLVWRVMAGEGLSWTVYVDAVTGETIATVQNFQT